MTESRPLPRTPASESPNRAANHSTFTCSEAKLPCDCHRMNRSRLHNSTEHTMHSCGHGSLRISHSDAWHRVECIPFTANMLSDCERRDLCAAAVRMRFGERIVRPHPRHDDGKMFACRLNRTIRKARIDQINGKTSSSALNLGRFVFHLQMQIPLNFGCAVRTSSDFTRKQKGSTAKTENAINSIQHSR